MLKKRIIPCLDIKDGRTVKGVQFLSLRDAGDPVALAKKYAEEGADELVFLDITATLEKRKTFYQLVEKIAAEINIPFTVGGGISTIEDASILLRSGADKISVNSSALSRPELLTELAMTFGNQCVVIAIDTKKIDGKDEVFSHGGSKPTGRETIAWAQEAEQLGAGEILLTSMNHDGTKDGFALEIVSKVTEAVSIPVIASGGAGNMAHFTEVFSKTNASAALAASVFHFGTIEIPALKKVLSEKNIAIR